MMAFQVRRILLSLLLNLLLPGLVSAQDSSELDSFMEKVLEKREINWSKTQSYVFHEKEVLEIQGLNIPAIESFVREYVWIVRDGELVRSPVLANGVPVSQEEQRRYEDSWKKKKSNRQSIERSNFFEFKFEPGNYVFAGREIFEDREVVVIEYYPEHLFSDRDQDSKDDEGDEEDRYEEMLDKTSLVRMWIVPEDYQITRITLENTGLDFLPYRWLVRIDDLKASMVIDKPLEDVWLPREITASAQVSTATNFLRISYSRNFYDYREADVEVHLDFQQPGEQN
jgi:hypothetical protein